MREKHGLTKDDARKIEYGIRVMVCAMVCVFLLFAVLGNVLATHSSGISFVIVVVATVAMLWFVSGFCEKTAGAYKSWLIFIFLSAFVLRLIILRAWPIAPSGDFKSTYDTALALAGADSTEIKIIMESGFEYYYSTWSVHMPFILLETAIIKVFGEVYYPIQVIFNVFASLNCVMAAIIAKTLYKRCAGIITGITMAFLPLSLMYSPVLSNQHMASFFFLVAIYALIEKPIKRRLVNVALAAVCTSFSQLVRPEMPVFIIAVMCYFIYKYIILGMRRKRNLKVMIKKVVGYGVMFLGIYILLIFVVKLSIQANGYMGKNVNSGNYKYKVATGLNTESDGRWNEGDSRLANDELMLDKLIKERTRNKLDLVVLMAKKIMYQYGTYNYPWCIEGKAGNFVEKWYKPLTNGTMLVILLLCLLKVMVSMFNKSRREVLLLTTMLGYFLTFMVIEVQNRYNYFMIPIFVIFASGALVHLYEYAQMYIENIKNKR